MSKDPAMDTAGGKEQLIKYFMDKWCRLRIPARGLLLNSWLTIMLLACQDMPCRAGNEVSQKDSVSIGEMLFRGISRTGDSTLSCVRCHNIAECDTFNWNPSALEIALKYQFIDAAALEEAILFPMTGAAYESHEAALGMESDDIRYIKNYLDLIASKGLIPKKKDRSKKLQFMGWFFLITFVFTDLLLLKLIKRRYIHLLLFITAVIFIIKLTYKETIALGLQEGYQPLQPIKFSHQTHCGQNQIECLYCHMPANYGKSAGLPSVDICMNCHAAVVEASNSGEFEIRKIFAASDSKTPISWVRVNNLPDHVYFNHMSHYKIGKIDCAECHGQVEDHHQFIQEQELSMRWCLDCHNSRKVQFDNPYYEIYRQKKKQIVENEFDSVLVRDVGGWDCMQCHY